MLYYMRYRNYPAVPQEIIDEAVELTKGTNIRELSELYSKRNDTGEQASTICAYYPTVRIQEWFEDTIRPLIDNKDKALKLCIQTIGVGVKPHKDPARRVVLNYLIDTGGEEVYTTHHTEDKSMVVHKVKIEPLRWHELQTDIFHGVIGHVRKRVALTFDLVKYYGPIENYKNDEFLAYLNMSSCK